MKQGIITRQEASPYYTANFEQKNFYFIEIQSSSSSIPILPPTPPQYSRTAPVRTANSRQSPEPKHLDLVNSPYLPRTRPSSEGPLTKRVLLVAVQVVFVRDEIMGRQEETTCPASRIADRHPRFGTRDLSKNVHALIGNEAQL